MVEAQIKPGRWPYLLAVVILALAVALMTGSIVRGIQSVTGSDEMRMLAPGSKVFQLDDTGGYVIYHEDPGVIADKTYRVGWGLPTGLGVTLTKKDTGEKIDVGPSTTNYTYTVGSRQGQSIFAFDIVEPGQYEMTAAYDDGSARPQTVLAIGRGFQGGIAKGIFGSCFLLAGASVAAIIIVIVTLVKRGRSKSAARAAAVRATPPAATAYLKPADDNP